MLSKENMGGPAYHYRYTIDWLARKPGAFANYRYRDHLFPSSRFRMAYDPLKERIPNTLRDAPRFPHAFAPPFPVPPTTRNHRRHRVLRVAGNREKTKQMPRGARSRGLGGRLTRQFSARPSVHRGYMPVTNSAGTGWSPTFERLAFATWGAINSTADFVVFVVFRARENRRARLGRQRRRFDYLRRHKSVCRIHTQTWQQSCRSPDPTP